jgi:hypothetical protein
VAVLREERPYVIRDVDGTPVDPQEAKRIITERYRVPAEIRAARRQPRSAQRMKGRPTGRVRSKTSPPSPSADKASEQDGTGVLAEA